MLVSKPTVQNKNNIAVISLQNMLSRAVTDSWAQRWSHKFDTFRCVEPAQSMYSHILKDIRLLFIPSKTYQEKEDYSFYVFLQDWILWNGVDEVFVDECIIEKSLI